MSTILFAAHAAVGHLNPLLTIAQRMQSEGHDCVFTTYLTPLKTEQAITAHGFRCIGMRLSLQNLSLALLPYFSGYWETFFAARQFFNGLGHYTQAATRILDDIHPAAVVTDFGFLGPGLAAEAQQIPYVLIYHAGLSFKGEGIPPFGSGLPIGEPWGWQGRVYQTLSRLLARRIDTLIAHARRRFHLPPGAPEYLACPTSPWLTLVLTAEAAEVPRAPVPDNFFFIGPCFAGRKSDQAATFPFQQFSATHPKIYVSLGTVFNRKPHVFKKIIAAFADGRYQLIISAGAAFARLREHSLPPNVLLFERVPQVDVLAQVDAVISHGGNNTVNETLAAGKPLLVLPVGGEQGDNASRVVYLGAGLRADLKRSTAEEIQGKITQLLTEPAFRQKAQSVADVFAQTRGPITAARFITHVTQTRQPVRRPPGYPLTVTRDMPLPWENDKD